MNFGQFAVPNFIAELAAIALTAAATYWKGNIDRATRAAINFETKLRDVLEAQFGIPQPDTQQIHRGAIEEALTEQTAYDGSDSPIRTVYADGTYFAPTNSDDVNVIETLSSATGYLPYRPERFDCEDFAGAFQFLSAFVGGVNAVGEVYDWSGGHAYNVIVQADGTLVWYEPQDNEEVQIGQGDYPLQNALIVF